MKFLTLIFIFVSHLALAQDLTLDEPSASADPTSESVEQPALPPPTPPPSNSHADSRLHIGVGVSYSLNSRMKLDPVVYPPPSPINEVTTFEGDFSNVFAFEGEIRYLDIDAFGFIAAVTMDQLRTLNYFKLTGTTTVWFLKDGFKWWMNAKISTYELNAAGRTADLYVFAGLNYPQIIAESDDTSFGTITVNPSIGWQAGLGYYLTKYLLLEFRIRQIYFTMKSTFSDGSQIDFCKGVFSNSFATVKIIY